MTDEIRAWLERAPSILKALIVREEALLKRAEGTESFRWKGFPCPHCGKGLSVCVKHGPYARTDENQCPACRRGE